MSEKTQLASTMKEMSAAMKEMAAAMLRIAEKKKVKVSNGKSN